MKNILHSAAYEDICDHVILIQEDMLKYMKTFELLRKGCLIYCKTDFTPMLFEHLRFSNNTYVLISHHSDYPIDERWFNLKPKSIIKWFVINPTYKHPDLLPIPIGCKTPEDRAYHDNYFNMKWFVENLENLQNIPKNNEKVYCNWADHTNLYRTRILKELQVPYYKTSRLPNFESYCEDMAKYKFVISPPGNGIACERTWFALYCGCFPIIINHFMNDAWKELPIIQVKSYANVTPELLEKALNKEYNYEKMYLEYWHKKIRNLLI